MVKEVENKADYMLYEANERNTSIEKQKRQLELIEKQTNAVVFLAEDEGKLIGYLMAIGGTAQRKKHTAYIVVGVLNEHRGKGIGTILFKTLDEWTVEQKISRIELTVVTENVTGIQLYQKMGFEIEGTKRNSLIINGTYYDEYYMAKLK